jgi:N-acetyl-gamma-glutamyl-phosphate reductase
VPSVLVAGASGFAGALAADLLWRHPDFELVAVTARAEAGQRLSDLYPRHRVPLTLSTLEVSPAGEVSFDPGLGGDVEAAIVAYPHAASAPVVAALHARGTRVVDLSADYRLSDLATYERVYGPHPHPELIEAAVYGLTELHRAQIADATLVANPGCYPTGALLSLAPLARAELIADVIIDAKEGVSGAGRAPTAITHFSAAAENITPYKVASHRHTPEIEEQLARLGAPLAVQFQAHLVPFDQGQLTSCYVTPPRAVDQGELRRLFASAYAAEPFVELAERPPGVRDVRDTNMCRIHCRADPHTGKLLVFAALDNLWKGTSAQAVQNLNLMFGFDETAGLT